MRNDRLPFKLLALAAVAGAIGTPYLRITWECAASYGHCVRYIHCDYYGIGGLKTLVAGEGGDCGIVKFFPLFTRTPPPGDVR
jgi:hypothetical protein